MRIGHVIGGRFRVESLAGSGGMGRVYRALDQSTGKQVALKVLSLDASKYSRRFLREAKVMSELNHPNIVAYVEYGETTKGAPFIVMEWVGGEDLRQRMNRKRLELSEALDIIANVGGALAFAHRRGVIHRDLKPSNLMMGEGDITRIKLLDFGIARWRGPGAEVMTRTGISIGTPGYMAPEQSRGDKEIDGRADLYALGCVIYECLVGRRPFHGEDVVAVLARTALDEPPRISNERSDISEEFDDLLADMMATNVERRPDDGDVMAQRARAISSATKRRLTVSSGLTSSEKELIGILLISAAESEAELRSDVLLAGVLQRAGGESLLLENGTMVVTFRDEEGAATELASRSVRCALEVRKLRPSARLAVATCQSELSGRRALTKTIQSVTELLQMAESGPVPDNRPLTLRLDEATYRLVGSRFDIRRRRNDASGGLDLLGARHGNLGLQLSNTRCIGREAELLRITQLFAQTLAHQKPRSILVHGEAFVGKTRVCDEAISRLRASHSDLEVWSARGEAHGKDSAFHLLRQLLQSAAGVAEGDSLRQRQAKLKQRVAACMPEASSLSIANSLGELCNTPFAGSDNESQQPHTASERTSPIGDNEKSPWEEFLEAASAKRPILIVIDDLHWGDLPTLQLMDGALRNVSSGSWMLLAIARPDVDTVFPALWEERKLLRMPLKGLTERACRELIDSHLENKPDERAIRRIVRLSGGNAFYLEELIDSLQQGKGGEIPSTVLALAQARLRKLRVDSRWVLRAASVFGKSFWSGGVANLLGSNAQQLDLEKILGELTDIHLVKRGAGDRRLYSFQNELLREAVYSTLTDDDRDLGHRLAGTWLLDHGMRDPLILANHFELGRQPEQATQWYLIASRLALEDNDLHGSIAHAQKGIASGAIEKTLGLLHAVIATALLWAGENGKASEHSLAAIDELESGSDAWALAAGDGVTALGRCGAFSDITLLTNAMIAARRERGDSGPLLSALARSASRLFLAARYDEAVALLGHLPNRGSELAKLDSVALGYICAAKAKKQLCDGAPSTYLRLFQSSAEHFDSVGDQRTTAAATINVGAGHAQLGFFERAETILRESLRVALDMGLDALRSLARYHLGRVLLRQGQLDEAWDMERIAMESFQMQGDERLANSSRVYLSQIHQQKGLLDSAEKEVREALHGTSTVPTVRMLANAQLASVLLARGRSGQALECALEGQRILYNLGRVFEGESFVLLMVAEAHLQCSQLKLAKAAIARAYASVLRCTNQIDNSEWKLSFASRIKENARIIELSATWNAEVEASAVPDEF